MEQQNIVCHICASGENETKLLLCDGCNRGFHTFCLNIRKVPAASWYCPACVRSMTSTTTEPATTSATTKPKKVEKPKEVYVYIRVSSAGQNAPEFGRVGMDTQNSEILKFCMTNNIYIKSSITEVGSAYHTRTPKLLKLINKLKAGIPIMVFSFNRFSRNLVHAKQMVDAIHAKGSYVWSVTDLMTSNDPEFTNLIQAAENESRLNGQRIAAARARAIAQGGFVGRKPFGYNKVRVDGLFKLQENPLEQKIMKKIREMSKVKKPVQVLAIAKKKYQRYDWNMHMINECILNTIRLHYPIIPSNVDESKMDSLLDAIEEVEDSIEEEKAVVPTVVPAATFQIKCFHKIRKLGDEQYEILVEWKKAGPKPCTWENLASLNQDVPEMVEEFLKKSKSIYVKLACASIGLSAPIASKKKKADCRLIDC